MGIVRNIMVSFTWFAFAAGDVEYGIVDLVSGTLTLAMPTAEAAIFAGDEQVKAPVSIALATSLTDVTVNMISIPGMTNDGGNLIVMFEIVVSDVIAAQSVANATNSIDLTQLTTDILLEVLTAGLTYSEVEVKSIQAVATTGKRELTTTTTTIPASTSGVYGVPRTSTETTKVPVGEVSSTKCHHLDMVWLTCLMLVLGY
eukprot:gnl/MRDRNA2_/MRDRNA2_88476_c0_seq1.p1 gnl/MRDRNA2_/MRDRNA2_88476_c0~~gnl/MRDRNA2_/MRDRNA2_88476_c0_seq1.p1  ORF type:complete len:201 (-),score=20.85 gnl/MRDRNA2_/MRDRNA2_88476_c0_seq1:188-790(-)